MGRSNPFERLVRTYEKFDRLDRLESAQTVRSRLMWIITGSTVALALSAIWKLVIGG